MGMKVLLKPIIIVCLLAAASTGLSIVLYHEASEHAVLRARAHKLFAYDRDHKDALPAHQLRALSLAIEFHNDRGAESLIEQLERSI